MFEDIQVISAEVFPVLYAASLSTERRSNKREVITLHEYFG